MTNSPIRYLNTDLDLFSSEPLTDLASALEQAGMILLHVGELDGDWRARLETGETFDTPERTIAAMLDLIEALPEPMKERWDRTSWREFNVGYDVPDGPQAFDPAFPGDLIARVAALGASVQITLYPPDPASES